MVVDKVDVEELTKDLLSVDKECESIFPDKDFPKRQVYEQFAKMLLERGWFKCKDSYYKVCDDVDLRLLTKRGFKNISNFNRGECYERVDDTCPGGGIHIAGNWDDRRITFLFPYRDNLPPTVENYIRDLMADGLVEFKRQI